MGNRWGDSGNSVRLYFGGAPKSLQRVTAVMKLKDAYSLEEKLWPIARRHIKKQRHYFVHKDPFSQGYAFSSSHVWMWELDYKESWTQKNWWFWTVVLEKTLENPLDCKEIQPVHPKGDQSWVFIGRTDVEVETPILWPPDAKNWLIEKDPDVGKDWRWEEKRMAEDEMAGWHHWWTWWHHSMGMSFSKLWELVTDREAWHAMGCGVTKSWTWLSDWNELNCVVSFSCVYVCVCVCV